MIEGVDDRGAGGGWKWRRGLCGPSPLHHQHHGASLSQRWGGLRPCGSLRPGHLLAPRDTQTPAWGEVPSLPEGALFCSRGWSLVQVRMSPHWPGGDCCLRSSCCRFIQHCNLAPGAALSSFTPHVLGAAMMVPSTRSWKHKDGWDLALNLKDLRVWRKGENWGQIRPT